MYSKEMYSQYLFYSLGEDVQWPSVVKLVQNLFRQSSNVSVCVLTIIFSGLFYWSLLNVPAEYRSQLRFIHLFAVAYNKDIKQYSINPILQKLTEEMIALQTVEYNFVWDVIL